MDDILDAFALDSTKKRNRSQERNVITTRRVSPRTKHKKDDKVEVLNVLSKSPKGLNTPRSNKGKGYKIDTIKVPFKKSLKAKTMLRFTKGNGSKGYKERGVDHKSKIGHNKNKEKTSATQPHHDSDDDFVDPRPRNKVEHSTCDNVEAPYIALSNNRIRIRNSPIHMDKLLKGLSAKQRLAVEKIGFGGYCIWI
ncbi:hypothetical protein Hanom_Chr09g00817971 [Helianthus anomalus]